MPEEIELMLTIPDCMVPHQPDAGFERENVAPMNHRIRQSTVAIVATHKKIERLSRNPALSLHMRQPPPTEGTSRLGLILSCHHQRIVRPGAAETVALIAGSNVFKSPAIDQQLMTVPACCQAKGISVAMARTLRPLRTRINHQLPPRITMNHV